MYGQKGENTTNKNIISNNIGANKAMQALRR
jgi:hypothetical protein